MTDPTGPTTLIGNPDEFDGIVEQFDDTPWGAVVNLTHEPLRPDEIKRQNAYLKAVPGSSPWSPFVQVYVLPNGLISIARMDDPHDGWVMTTEEKDALIAVLCDADRHVRLSTPAPPDAA